MKYHLNKIKIQAAANFYMKQTLGPYVFSPDLRQTTISRITCLRNFGGVNHGDSFGDLYPVCFFRINGPLTHNSQLISDFSAGCLSTTKALNIT